MSSHASETLPATSYGYQLMVGSCFHLYPHSLCVRVATDVISTTKAPMVTPARCVASSHAGCTLSHARSNVLVWVRSPHVASSHALQPCHVHMTFMQLIHYTSSLVRRNDHSQTPQDTALNCSAESSCRRIKEGCKVPSPIFSGQPIMM